MRTDRCSPARPLLAALVALATFAGACTGTSEPPPILSATPAASFPQTLATPVPGNVTSVPQGILDSILADASARTGAAVGDITVLTAKAVTWPNGALGCPQPGFMYTEMIETGYQVVVEAAGTQLDYRVGSAGIPSLCENPPTSG